MRNLKYKPENITRPIQLLASWLLGLIAIDGMFLFTATKIGNPLWVPVSLIIASIINVPIFVICIFILQTKFRPEMQEDKYYVDYLKRKVDKQTIQLKRIDPERHTKMIATQIKSLLESSQSIPTEQIETIIRNNELERLEQNHGWRRTVSELYLYQNKWPIVAERWRNDFTFLEDVETLKNEGIVESTTGTITNLKLTMIGEAVAKLAEERGHLWNQNYPDSD